MLRSSILATAALVFALLRTASAQVTVSQPTEIEKVPCPMQLDMSLGRLGTRPSLAELQVGHALVSHEMQKYVCHTERVSGVMVSKADEGHGRLHLSITTTVRSEQWRQDVDLTVSLLDPAGKPVCSNTWKDLTVGKDRAISNFTWVTMASSTKTPQMDCRLDSAKFAAMFAGEQKPTLRVVLNPKLDPDDKE